MPRKSSAACLAALLFLGAAQAQVTPAPPPLRDELVAPLRAAQELLGDRKFAEALAQLAAAEKVAGKTPVETYFVERLRAAAASGAGDTQQAATSLEAVLASGQTPKTDEPALIEALAGAHYNLKHYKDAALWAGRHAERGGSTPAMRQMLVQSLYLAEDFKGVVQQLLALQREQLAAGQPTPQAQLDMLAASYIKLQDDAGYMQVLEQLLRGYPSADYWADLLVRMERRPGFSQRLVIDLFRLQFAARALAEANDYLELAQLAAQAGYPAEAQAVLEAGFAARVLGAGADADKHLRFQQQVVERAQADLKNLDLADRQPAAARDSEALFKLGYSYVTHGRVDAGLALMQEAVDKGDLPQANEARLRLAAAYAQAGNKAKARELLQAVQGAGGTDGASDLARLWGVLIAR